MNWFLLIVAIYFGLKQKWWQVFLMGLLADLISGGRLGGKAFIFLMVVGMIKVLKQYSPIKSSGQLKLKLE